MNDSTPYITHQDLSNFVSEKVNLKKEHHDKYRAQAKRVRDQIERYAEEHPEVGFMKTLLSGSLAKHTAIRGMNDIDIGLYVKDDVAPHELADLLVYIRDRLKTTYPTSEITINEPCVVIHFTGTDLDIEIMPIMSDGNAEGYGLIWARSPYANNKTYTSIPRHLEFIAKRRTKTPTKFAEIVRLIKHWRNEQGLEFRSFMIELVLSKLSDSGISFDDYKKALISFFNYLLSTDISDPIFFTDYFDAEKFTLGDSAATVEIWDPVTPDNNVSSDYTTSDRNSILEAAEQAIDAINYAENATTKGDAIECWKDVFGATFN